MRESTRVEVTFRASTIVETVHVILKTITRTRTPKGGGFGLTTVNSTPGVGEHVTLLCQ